MSDIQSTSPTKPLAPHLEMNRADVPPKALDLAAFLVERCQSLTSLFPGKLNFSPRLETGCIVSSVTAQEVADILAVTVENTIRHAHPAGLTAFVAVDCRLLPNGKIGVDICDDGVGLPEGYDGTLSDGAGFSFIRASAAKIDAALTIETSELGLCVRLMLPQQTRKAESRAA